MLPQMLAEYNDEAHLHGRADEYLAYQNTSVITVL